MLFFLSIIPTLGEPETVACSCRQVSLASYRLSETYLPNGEVFNTFKLMLALWDLESSVYYSMTVTPIINPPIYRLENMEYSFSQYELVNMGHLSQNFWYYTSGIPDNTLVPVWQFSRGKVYLGGNESSLLYSSHHNFFNPASHWSKFSINCHF